MTQRASTTNSPVHVETRVGAKNGRLEQLLRLASLDVDPPPQTPVEELRSMLVKLGFDSLELRNASDDSLELMRWQLRDALPKLCDGRLNSASMPIGMVDDVTVTIANGRATRAYTARWPAVFWTTVSDLLMVEGKDLRRCPECASLFVRSKRQTYCGVACSQRARSRRWYSNNREVALERRHEAHYAKRRKRHPKLRAKPRAARSRPGKA